MQYTKDQLLEAMQLAADNGDMKAATEIAELLNKQYGAHQPSPPTPKPTLKPRPYGEQVAQRFEEFDPMGIISEFPEQVSQRAERMAVRDPGGMEYIPTAVSQLARTGGELLVGGVNILIPDSVREGAEEGWNKIKDTALVRQAGAAANAGYDVYKEWAARNPEFAETFETYVDIGTLFAPAKEPIELAAKKAKRKYNTKNLEERRAGINKLMDPQIVGETGYKGDFRSVGGPLDRTVYVPTEREQIMRLTLETVEDLDPNSHYARAYTVVGDDVSKSAKQLKAFIRKTGNPAYQRDDLVNSFKEAFDEMTESDDFIALSNEAQKKALEYAERALQIVDKREANALGLLDARQRFDKLMNAGARKGDVLDPTVETAKGAAGRFIRNVMNNKLKEITVGDEVHNLLDRQHNLMVARDTLRMRMYGEGNNKISRLYDKIAGAANLPSTPLALYATLKTGGAAVAGAAVGSATGAAALTGAGVGAGIYFVLRQADKKTRLKFYSKMLSGTDKAMKVYSSDKNLVAQLKADRAYIVYLMDQARKEEEESGD